ncbi:31329_t:CDS:1, partial [Racocetra persica]
VCEPNTTLLAHVLVDYESDESDQLSDFVKSPSEFIFSDQEDISTMVDNKFDGPSDHLQLTSELNFSNLEDIDKTINNRSEESDEPDSLELTLGRTFSNWDELKNWIYRFAIKEGFNYKVRTSGIVKGLMRRVTYECTKSGVHNSQMSSDSTKR